MNVSLKPIDQQVMVITGASSGIGLATARLVAKQGARVVLNARSDETLDELVQEIVVGGGQAIAVPGDVSKLDDMARLSAAAIERFGGFDTWVNNAGTSIFGKLEEVSEEDHRRLFEINFWGVVHGSSVAVKHLRERGGALINLGSVASDVVLPLQGMYCATKHAIKAYTDALRMELEDDGAPISVTLIKPTSINTPFPQNSKNYMEHEPQLPPPVYPPEEVANAIVHAAVSPMRDVYVGGAGRVMAAIGSTAKRTFDWIGEKVMMNQQWRNESPREPQGTLDRPGRRGRVHGDHPGYVMKTSLYTRAALHPVLTSTLVAAAGVAAAAWLLAPRDRWRM
jgi:short-subunit dehydrogenase